MSQYPSDDVAGGLPAQSVAPIQSTPEVAHEDVPTAEADGEVPTLPIDPTPFGVRAARLTGRGPRPGKRLVSPQEAAGATRSLTPEQKLLILDTWQRSGLPAADFGTIVGLAKQTLYSWKKRFEAFGPEGLVDEAKRKLPTGSKLPEITRRAILMLKKANPEWGCQRISDVIYRGPGLAASAAAVARVLKEEGYVTEERSTTPHPDKVRSFERAAPNQLWQTDLFTFILKRQNRRVYLVAFMDDHSRFIVGYGIHASASSALVIEVFRAAVASVGRPEEVLTDNGPQYVTWRGTSQFAKELSKQGAKHIVATPRRPQTLGKTERFWGTLWRECMEAAIFLDLEDARRRIGHFIDYYNFQRPHQGLGGLAPADRFFRAAPQVLSTLKARVQANALQVARDGMPKAPFYLTGQVGGKPFSVHAEGERVFMVADDGQRQELDLSAGEQPIPITQPPPAEPVPEPVSAQGVVTGDLVDESEAPRPPGSSVIDELVGPLAQPVSPGAADLAAPVPSAPRQEEGAS